MTELQRQIQAALAAQIGEMHMQIIALQVELAEAKRQLAEAKSQA